MNSSDILTQSIAFLSRIRSLKKEDILPLRVLIRAHNEYYYQKEAPIISDREYDILFHALARLESDYTMLDEDSPTAHLAILASGQFKKVVHRYPMISLDNTYSLEDISEWQLRMWRLLENKNIALSKKEFLETTPYYIQPKFDGLGVSLIYIRGKFSQAITRGNGSEGEDVTLGAQEIDNIPKYISALAAMSSFEIRGEVVMNREIFTLLNMQRKEIGQPLFANTRNAASGSLRQLDPLVTRARRLDFFAYSFPAIEQAKGSLGERVINSYHELMDRAESWGFARKDFSCPLVYGSQKLLERITQETATFMGKETGNTDTHIAGQNLNRSTREVSFPFDIDGIVLKLDTLKFWGLLGMTEHHPRYSIAYKFPAKQVRTKVLSIEHSVGRTGQITPVANLEPVEVTGVSVKRASLHNYDELRKKDIREGDSVFIMRAGEVIPEVTSVITEVRTGKEKICIPPEYCPRCHTLLQKNAGKVVIFCPNPHCPAKSQGQIEMLASRQGLNIDGLGEKQILKFLELGWIHDFSSLFHLKKYREKLLGLDGYKERAVNNLLEALEQARHTTLARALISLGIANVGKKTANLLEEKIFSIYYKDLHKEEQVTESSRDTSALRFFPILLSLTQEDLETIADIGPQTAGAIITYIEAYPDIIRDFFTELIILDKEASGETHIKTQTLLVGKTFCVTGVFAHISREALHAQIEAHGGEVRSAVSPKLSYLICGEKAGSKKAKAENLGIACLSFEQFQDMITDAS